MHSQVAVNVSTPPTDVLHVLTVDDVAMNRDIAAYFLRSAGHKVICLDGGRAAVAAVEKTDFDVVLMDVRMPDMDGLEATRCIRALTGPRAQVPIVALTAYAFEEQALEFQKAGMNGHVAKPFDADTLVSAAVRASAARYNGNAFARTQFAKAASVINLDLPILELTVFRKTVSSLNSKMAVSYLQTVAVLCVGLLRMLHKRPPVAPKTDQLAAAAHTVAASAGMFGFERLAAIAREFQRAIELGAPQESPLTHGLSDTLRATLHELQNHNQ
jgi:CheY-like chemotaxis protein